MFKQPKFLTDFLKSDGLDSIKDTAKSGKFGFMILQDLVIDKTVYGNKDGKLNH
jgi:hypothetical protein